MHKPNGKKSSKTALLRIYLIIDSAKREKRKENRGEEKARSYWQVLCPGAAASNPSSSLGRAEHPSCPQPMCSLRCQSQMLSLFLHFTGRAQHKAKHATCSLSPTLIFLSFFFCFPSSEAQAQALPAPEKFCRAGRSRRAAGALAGCSACTHLFTSPEFCFLLKPFAQDIPRTSFPQKHCLSG